MRAVVIGGGLAGCAAALELAAHGADTVLVRRGPGSTAMIGGCLDLAGASPLRRGGPPVREPEYGRVLSPRARLAMARQHSHPYARAVPASTLESGVKEAAAALDAWLEPAGLRAVGGLDETRWLADVRGAVRASDLSLTGPAEGALDGAAELALVDVPGLQGWDAQAALCQLASERSTLGLERVPLRVIRLGLPEGWIEAGGAPARLAQRFESPEGIEALQRAVSKLGTAGRLLLFPPVLGLLGVGRVLAAVVESAGCRVGELVGALPHTPAGFRLDAALRAALERSGVALRSASVASVEESDASARAVVLEGGESIAADAVVLAAGRFVGGGLVERDGALREPLLDLPLYDLSGRRVDGVTPRRLIRRDYEGEQPLFASGVRVDGRLRPLSPDGTPRLANLFAAGDLLGGFDPARDRTGAGVALFSGRRAGIEAAAAAEAGPC